MNLRVTRVFLVFHAEQLRPVLSRLDLETARTPLLVGQEVNAAADALLAHVQQSHWYGEHAAADGLLYLTSYQGPALDPEHDPLLPVLLAWALPGSVLEGYEPETGQWWQLRLAPDPQWVQGTTRFASQDRIARYKHTLVRVREANEADLPALLALSRRPVSLAQGPVLLAARERILAFLQYHQAAQEEQAAIITRLATRAHGWDDGDPLRLLVALQQRYQRLVLVSELLPLHRYLRSIGFVHEGRALHWRKAQTPRHDHQLPPGSSSRSEPGQEP